MQWQLNLTNLHLLPIILYISRNLLRSLISAGHHLPTLHNEGRPHSTMVLCNRGRLQGPDLIGQILASTILCSLEPNEFAQLHGYLKKSMVVDSFMPRATIALTKPSPIASKPVTLEVASVRSTNFLMLSSPKLLAISVMVLATQWLSA